MGLSQAEHGDKYRQITGNNGIPWGRTWTFCRSMVRRKKPLRQPVSGYKSSQIWVFGIRIHTTPDSMLRQVEKKPPSRVMSPTDRLVQGELPPSRFMALKLVAEANRQKADAAAATAEAAAAATAEADAAQAAKDEIHQTILDNGLVALNKKRKRQQMEEEEEKTLSRLLSDQMEITRDASGN
jgi:hypothetical protein